MDPPTARMRLMRTITIQVPKSRQEVQTITVMIATVVMTKVEEAAILEVVQDILIGTMVKLRLPTLPLMTLTVTTNHGVPAQPLDIMESTATAKLILRELCFNH
jgi:hypothetical protein